MNLSRWLFVPAFDASFNTSHTHKQGKQYKHRYATMCMPCCIIYCILIQKKTKEREREFQWFDPCIGGLLQKKRYSWQSMRIVHNGWISMHSRKMETACHLAHIFRSLCDICCCCRYFFFPILLDVFQHIHCACVNRPLHLRSERWTICFLFLAVCVCVCWCYCLYRDFVIDSHRLFFIFAKPT